jgi:hypothetical protein
MWKPTLLWKLWKLESEPLWKLESEPLDLNQVARERLGNLHCTARRTTSSSHFFRKNSGARTPFSSVVRLPVLHATSRDGAPALAGPRPPHRSSSLPFASAPQPRWAASPSQRRCSLPRRAASPSQRRCLLAGLPPVRSASTPRRPRRAASRRRRPSSPRRAASPSQGPRGRDPQPQEEEW